MGPIGPMKTHTCDASGIDIWADHMLNSLFGYIARIWKNNIYNSSYCHH